MAHVIPFSFETFKPISIKGNLEDPKPVEFELEAVGGSDRARLRAIILASEGMTAGSAAWTPEVQAAVVAAFDTGAAAFRAGVRSVRNLSATAAHAVRVGILPPDAVRCPQYPNAKIEPDALVPILTGSEFAAVAGFFPLLAFEVAIAIARLSGQSEIDPRFFDWLSTSYVQQRERPRARGSARRARRSAARSGTAASSE